MLSLWFLGWAFLVASALKVLMKLVLIFSAKIKSQWRLWIYSHLLSFYNNCWRLQKYNKEQTDGYVKMEKNSENNVFAVTWFLWHFSKSDFPMCFLYCQVFNLKKNEWGATLYACSFVCVFAFATRFIFVVEDQFTFVTKPNGYTLTHRALLFVLTLFNSSILFPL